MKKYFIKKIALLLCTICISFSTISLTGCAQKPPQQPENICRIFKQYHSWYWQAQVVEKRWHLPIPVLMAVIYQESRFNASAKPPREKLLWIIPWFRPTSAYGYSQAVKQTWKLYKRETGHSFVSREAFDDAADFIGWYTHMAHRKAGINQHQAFAVYLAYHEGIGGYQKHTYRKKPWLIQVAQKVERRAKMYQSQLNQCQKNLPSKPFWHI
jgi:hypothetical protein